MTAATGWARSATDRTVAAVSSPRVAVAPACTGPSSGVGLRDDAPTGRRRCRPLAYPPIPCGVRSGAGGGAPWSSARPGRGRWWVGELEGVAVPGRAVEATVVRWREWAGGRSGCEAWQLAGRSVGRARDGRAGRDPGGDGWPGCRLTAWDGDASGFAAEDAVARCGAWVDGRSDVARREVAAGLTGEGGGERTEGLRG